MLVVVFSFFFCRGLTSTRGQRTWLFSGRCLLLDCSEKLEVALTRLSSFFLRIIFDVVHPLPLGKTANGGAAVEIVCVCRRMRCGSFLYLFPLGSWGVLMT